MLRVTLYFVYGGGSFSNLKERKRNHHGSVLAISGDK
jgi:hypothetical protein